jgi:hypothetical protein
MRLGTFERPDAIDGASACTGVPNGLAIVAKSGEANEGFLTVAEFWVTQQAVSRPDVASLRAVTL